MVLFWTRQKPEFGENYKIKPEQPIKRLWVLDFVRKFKIQLSNMFLKVIKQRKVIFTAQLYNCAFITEYCQIEKIFRDYFYGVWKYFLWGGDSTISSLQSHFLALGNKERRSRRQTLGGRGLFWKDCPDNKSSKASVLQGPLVSPLYYPCG